MDTKMEDVSSLAPKFPGYIGDQTQVIPGAGLICDVWDDQQDQRFALSRYASFTMFGSGVAANSDILFSADKNKVDLFNKGVSEGESGSAATGIGFVTASGSGGSITTVLALTDAETNTDREGAFSRSGGFFMVQGYGASLSTALTYQEDGSVDVDPVALFYAPRAMVALYELSDVQSKYQDSRCFRRDGKLGNFPSPNQIKGGDQLTVGQPVTNQFTPLQYPYFVSGRNTSNQIDIQIILDRDITIVHDTNQATPENFVLQIFGNFYCFGVQWCPGVIAQLAAGNPQLAQ